MIHDRSEDKIRLLFDRRFRFFLSLSLSSLNRGASRTVFTFSSYLRWPSILSIHHRVSIGEHLLRQKLSALPSTVCRSARLPSARSAELSFLSRFFHSRSRYPSSPPPPDKRIAFASISRRKEKRIDEFDSMNNSIRERENRNFAGTRGFVRGGDFAREKETTIRIGGTSEGARTAATVPAASCYRCRKDGAARRVDGWTTGGRVGVATAAAAAAEHGEREREGERKRGRRRKSLEASRVAWPRLLRDDLEAFPFKGKARSVSFRRVFRRRRVWSSFFRK